MNEEQFRGKVYWITFLFSMLVVWVHSCNAELFMGLSGMDLPAGRIEKALGETLGQMAVPGFFMVSAYLFYRRFGWEQLAYKWKSRVHSVLVPFLLWNFLYYLGYVCAARLPAAARLVGKASVPFNWEQLVRAVVFYQYNPVFWYLYQLVLLIALAPVIWFLMRSNATALAAAAFLLFFIWKGWSFPQLNADALFYYSAAAWAALHRQKEGRFAEGGNAAGWLVPAGVLAVLGALALLFGRPGLPLYNNPLKTVLIRLVMASLAWMAVSLAPLPAAPRWIKNSFFLYAVHFALVRFANKAGARLFPSSETAALVLFLLLPAFTAAVSYGLTRLMTRYSPRLYDILSGGRGAARHENGGRAGWRRRR